MVSLNILKLDNKGFVLMEFLVALVILTTIAGFGLFFGMDLLRNFSFNYEKNLLINILQKSRSKALANINQSNHGFYFDSANKSYVIFQGDSYLGHDATLDETFPAGKNIEVSGIPAGGIIFHQLSADSLPVNITISDGIRSAIISINEEGRISW